MSRLYHISPIENRKSILESGLKPSAGERALRFGQTEKRIYLIDRLWKLNRLLSCSMWNTHPSFKEGFDVFQINEDIELFRDEKFEYGLYSKQTIEKIEFVTTLKNSK